MVGKTGIPSVSNLPSFSTWSQHPQPQASGGAGGEDGDVCEAGLAEVSRSKSGGSGGGGAISTRRLHMPSLPNTRSAKNAASKASKAATKGANKMASAMGKKLRFTSKSKQVAKHAVSDGQPQVVGRDESNDLLNDSSDDSSDDDEEWRRRQQNGEEDHSLLHAQYSPQSTPSTDRPRSPECLSRQQSENSSEVQSATSSSDSDAIGRQSEGRWRSKPSVPKPAPKQKLQPETWDAKAFADKPRPLTCGSIWDIPTSRVPNPEPAPVRPREMNRQVVEGVSPSRHGEQHSSPRRLPKLGVSVEVSPGSPKRSFVRQTGRSVVVVCAVLSMVVAAVAGAMLLMN